MSVFTTIKALGVDQGSGPEAGAGIPAAASESRLGGCSETELLNALFQYRSDLLHPPACGSAQRRLAMIDALIAKAGAA